jgi:squalene-hopene/tetraprenyl-beta-curcumene cyclase
VPSDALRSAVDWLLDHQDAAGWWSGELETNVTMTAEHVLLLRFLGVTHDDIRDGAIRHIVGAQRDDGSWALYHDGPGDLSTTIEAYVALRVLGVDAEQPAMRRALRMILEQGGLVEARVFTKIWLALFGVYPWDGVPSMPPELVHLPSWAPLNLYDFACWARGTIAPLLIVISHRPVRDLGVDVSEVIVPASRHRMHTVAGSGMFLQLDKVLKLYERLPRQPGRAASRTVGGAGFSLHGCTHSSRCTWRAWRSTIRSSVAGSRGSGGSPSTTSTAGVSRHACRRCGTRRGRCSRCAKPVCPASTSHCDAPWTG